MLFRWIALAFIGCLPATLHGATEESVDSLEQTETETEEARQIPADTSEPSEERFLPTEEISEDFAAPFPVDI